IMVSIGVIAKSINYCSKNLCQDKTHIACNNNGVRSFSPRCENPKIVTITPKIRDFIVNRHNQLRNQIAKGFPPFKPAARMATMRWHGELARLAELNVRQCAMIHDECRNTDAFRYAGQNLGEIRSSRAIDVLKALKFQIQSWFDEYKDTPVDLIDKFRSLESGAQIGHFTAIIQDKSTHIGCAIMHQTLLTGRHHQLLACNYAYTNVLHRPVYVTGRSASKCTTGTNANYTSLCSVNEKYSLVP
ncbi:antigen 5 like allergen Cul n 1-like, partial [Musca vetustissima]|uniref:antigen 5 like allergen Cul n 1-like n=1 Tax=Musca vetustissima TaxID=27455 RepID=UPI002AB7EC89